MARKSKVVTHLIEHESAEINVTDWFGDNAPTIVADVWNLELVKCLIEKYGHIVDDRTLIHHF
jgi:hypothetical protein